MRRLIAGLAAILLLPACAAETTAPTGALSGTWSAGAVTDASSSVGVLRFVTVANGEATDWLARGATITLFLRADGTTAGTLTIPGLNDDGIPAANATLRADLTGSWSLVGGTLRLSHAADTFLRDMDFTLNGRTLSAVRTFGDVTVSVVLLHSAS